MGSGEWGVLATKTCNLKPGVAWRPRLAPHYLPPPPFFWIGEGRLKTYRLNECEHRITEDAYTEFLASQRG